MNTLVELTQVITAYKQDIQFEKDRCEQNISLLKEKLLNAELDRGRLSRGLDLDKLHIAENCFSFYGDPTISRHGDYPDQHRGDTRTKLIEDAIRLIGESQEALSKNYLGVKNYASFGDQREDHEYYMGPRHGEIVFAVKRLNRDAPLTDEQREAAIYYLLNWKTIYQSKKAA